MNHERTYFCRRLVRKFATCHPRMFLVGSRDLKVAGFPPKRVPAGFRRGARGNDDLRLSFFVVTHQVRRFAGMTTKALMQRS